MSQQLTLQVDHTAAAPFRPIHYLGNKWRALDAIESVVDEHAKSRGPVCDLFSGSGVVTQRLAQRRQVIAADIQEYSRVLTSALLHPVKTCVELTRQIEHESHVYEDDLLSASLRDLIDQETRAVDAALSGKLEPLCDLIEKGSLEAALRPSSPELSNDHGDILKIAETLPSGPGTTMSRYYGGVYFSYAQAVALDSLAVAIRRLPEPHSTMFLAALLSTASEIVSTVGNQFAQPVRPRASDGVPKRSILASVAKRRKLDARRRFAVWLDRYQRLTPAPIANHVVSKMDYRDVLEGLPRDTAAIYADPPYTRDHYSRFYHVLETIAMGDDPAISTMTREGVPRLSRGLYREQRHQSPFCIKSQVIPAFNSIFKHARSLGAPLVISYSPYTDGTPARPQPRLVTIDQLTDLASEHFAEVKVVSAGRFAHSKLNRGLVNGSTNYDAEVLLVAHS